jgi:hypothetical protein
VIEIGSKRAWRTLEVFLDFPLSVVSVAKREESILPLNLKDNSTGSETGLMLDGMSSPPLRHHFNLTSRKELFKEL